MKKYPSFSSSLKLAAALLALQTSAALADFNPVALTQSSYTFNIVVNTNVVQAVPYCVNAFAGSGYCLGCDTTYYEQSYVTPVPGTAGYNSGIPMHGTVFTNINNTNMAFLMPPDYTTSNVLMIVNNNGAGYGSVTSGTLTLTTPVTATSLALLTTGGNGGCSVTYTVNHVSGSPDTGSLTVYDWFNGGPSVAWGANGRVDQNGNLSAYSASTQNNGAPYLYGQTISVSAASPVTSVTLNYGSGGGVDNFYALSAANGTSVYSPVAVTGFNVISTVPAAIPFPVDATMDNGTNISNAGNTWFSQGYYQANTNYGIPPSESIFNSHSQPTHHYQMGNYSTNDAILIDTNHQVANIVPASPQTDYAFAFLTAGGNIGGGNKMTNICILQHADGVNETNLFFGYDWFEQGVPGALAYEANGRVNLNNRTLNNLGNQGLPFMFETYFTLNDDSSPVTNIQVRYKAAPGASSTTYIMAVSASTTPIAPVITQNPQPTHQAWFPGQTATLSVLATGSAPLTNVWLVENNGVYVPLTDGLDAQGSYISGSSTPTLTISNLTQADGTNYEYEAINASGSQSSTPANIYIKGKAGVMPISVWNNIANETYPNGNSTNIYAGDGSTNSVVLTLSGNAITNAYNSGITGDGANYSLMHGYMDVGANNNGTAYLTVDNLAGTNYNLYIYCFPDQSRPSTNTDLLPNYGVNGTTYYVPVLGGTGATTYDTTSNSVGGVGFTDFLGGTTQSTNDNLPAVTANFGNYIEIANVTPQSGEIDITAGADVSSLRSPVNGFELVDTSGGPNFGVHFLGNTTDYVTGVPAQPIIDSQTPTNSISVLTNHTDTTTFSVTVDPTSSPPLIYQWYSVANNVTNAIPGATGSSFVNVDTSNATYYCIVSNFVGTATSSPISIIVFTPPALTAYQSAVFGYHPVAYWPLSESNGTIAFDYAGTNDGTYTGNVQLGQPGLPPTVGIGVNSSVFFDGSTAYVNIPGAGELNIKGPITVIEWLQCPSGGDTGFTTPIGHSDQSYRLDVAGGQPHFADDGPDITGPATVNDGNWHQLIGVYDGTQQHLYVDGQQVSTPAASTPIGSTDALTIGAAPDYLGARNFKGNIAQVAILTNALSSSQVAGIYAALDTPPSVTISPANPSIYAGTSQTLTASLSGTPATSLQWYVIDTLNNSNNIAGATNTTYAITDVQLTENGYTYGINAYNAYGAANASVVLSVQNGPAYLPTGSDLAPLYAEAYVGSPVTYTIVAAGSLPIYYQWSVNGTNVNGATNSSFSMAAECGTNMIQVGFSNAASAGTPVLSSPATVIGDAYPPVVTFETNGTGWQFNPSGTGLPSITGNVLELTDNKTGEATSAFYYTAEYVGSFTASFTYTAGGSAAADGVAFILQDSSQGTNALGGGGGELGYYGISNSLALEINLYTYVGIAADTNGNTYGSGTGAVYGPTGPISVNSGDPINFVVSWANGVLNVNMRDATTQATFTTNYTFGPLVPILGSDLAYVGFSGADGGSVAIQTISNFAFFPGSPGVLLTASAVTNGSFALTWPVSATGFLLQSASSLNGPWSPGPASTVVGANNQVIISVSGGGQQFYRLEHETCP